MPLILNEEQSQLRDSARDFLAEQSPVSQLRALRDNADADGFSRPLWARFAEMGFTGVLVAEAQGGLGLGHVEAGVVMEQIGHQLCASPLLASAIVAATAIRQAGSAAQQAAWLPRIARAIRCNGSGRCAVVITLANTTGNTITIPKRLGIDYHRLSGPYPNLKFTQHI